MLTKLRRSTAQKPFGWYWDVTIGWPMSRWFHWSKLDLRPAGEPLQEWFLEMGLLTVMVGHLEDAH